MDNVAEVLQKAWRGGFKTKSNFARKHANEIAMCSSLGLITTTLGNRQFSNEWFITKTGMEYYNECYQS